MAASPRVLVFDAYGTLFDVESVAQACEAAFPGKGQAVTELWRQKQLEYTWLQSLMGRYVDFWELTRAGLIQACGQLNVPLDPAVVAALTGGYWTLQAFAEARPVLERLHGRVPLAILSNGTPEMLRRAAEHSGLAPLLDAVLSVDAVRVYKPSPRVYQLVCDRFGVAAADVGFVSGNAWDARGAKAFGFRVYWLNRAGRPFDPIEPRPDVILRGLTELATAI